MRLLLVPVVVALAVSAAWADVDNAIVVNRCPVATTTSTTTTTAPPGFCDTGALIDSTMTVDTSGGLALLAPEYMGFCALYGSMGVNTNADSPEEGLPFTLPVSTRLIETRNSEVYAPHAGDVFFLAVTMYDETVHSTFAPADANVWNMIYRRVGQFEAIELWVSTLTVGMPGAVQPVGTFTFRNSGGAPVSVNEKIVGLYTDNFSLNEFIGFADYYTTTPTDVPLLLSAGGFSDVALVCAASDDPIAGALSDPLSTAQFVNTWNGATNFNFGTQQAIEGNPVWLYAGFQMDEVRCPGTTSTTTTTLPTTSTTTSAPTTTTTTTTTTVPTTSTTTSTTTTTTTSTTTTTVALDNFERASLGANWSDSGFSGVATCTIAASSDFSATGTGEEMCFWNVAAPPTVGYACAQLSGAGTAGDFSGAGVCLGVDAVSTGNGVCCDVKSTGGPFTWAMNTITAGSTVEDEHGSDAFAVGDYIGIQRTSATAFRCYHSTDGTTWTALGAGATTSAPNPGSAGIDASATANAWTLESWEADSGGLPTGHACGGSTTTTTSTTTSTVTTTSTTTTTTTTTTSTSTTASSTTTTTALATTTTTQPPPSCALLVANHTNADQTSYTTASITPTGNDLVIATFLSMTPADLPVTVSGNSLTWVEFATVNWNDGAGNFYRLTSYRAMGASPTAGGVTFDFSGVTQAGGNWSIMQCSNVDQSGTNGSGAVRNPTTNTATAATSLTITLPAFLKSNDGTYGTFGQSGANGTTPGSGFTELSDIAGANPSCALQTEWRNSNDTTVSASGLTSTNWGGVAFEIVGP